MRIFHIFALDTEICHGNKKKRVSLKTMKEHMGGIQNFVLTYTEKANLLAFFFAQN